MRSLRSHWRFSQVWSHWIAAGTTTKLFQQLQDLLVLAQRSESINSTVACRALDAGVSILALLAKLVLLSEEQVLQQLAPDVTTATRCAQ